MSIMKENMIEQSPGKLIGEYPMTNDDEKDMRIKEQATTIRLLTDLTENETISDYTGQKTYDVECRLRTKNRGYCWYQAVGKPTRRPDGSPITYVGVFIDITDHRAGPDTIK